MIQSHYSMNVAKYRGEGSSGPYYGHYCKIVLGTDEADARKRYAELKEMFMASGERWRLSLTYVQYVGHREEEDTI
jgi:hypothetical protein